MPSISEPFAATGKLIVRCSHDLAAIANVEGQWRVLYESSRTTNPFLDPAWSTAAYQNQTGRTATPWFVHVYSGETLVAVAPFELQAIGGRRSGLRVLRIAGADSYIGVLELPSVLVDPTVARSAVRAVVEYVCSRSTEWAWCQLPLSPTIPWFEPSWLPTGAGFTSVDRMVRPEVVLPTAVGAPISSRNLKESLRRARNRLTRDFGDHWQVECADVHADLRPALESLFELHTARSTIEGKVPHDNRVANAVTRTFLRSVLLEQVPEKSVQLYSLRAGGDVLAQLLTLSSPTATYCSISGFRADAWAYSPTTLLQWHAYVDACERGDAVFSLSTGPDRQKLRWTHQVDSHTEFVIIAPRRTARTAYTAYAQAALARRISRERLRHRIDGAGTGVDA